MAVGLPLYRIKALVSLAAAVLLIGRASDETL
jgi:hypothetical protein